MPANTAWRVNSRLRKPSATERISRASNGQPKQAMIERQGQRGQVVPQHEVEQHEDRKDRQGDDDVVDDIKARSNQPPI